MTLTVAEFACRYCEEVNGPDVEVCVRCGSVIGELRVDPPVEVERPTRPEAPVPIEEPTTMDVVRHWWLLLTGGGLTCLVLGIWAAHFAIGGSWDTSADVGVGAAALVGGSIALVIGGRSVVTARVRRRNQEMAAAYERTEVAARTDYESRLRWSAADHVRRLHDRENVLEMARRRIVEARQTELLTDCDASQWTAHLRESTSDTDSAAEALLGRFARLEAGSAGALSAAELLWSWARIDPDVIRASAFAAPGADIPNGFDFVGYMHDHFATLGPDAQAHAFDRLVGYVGEQQYYDLMTAHGDTVVQAVTPNQPVWDFIVNGHAVNVKTVADVSSIHEAASAHPDVLYAVPADASGHLTANMQQVAGLSHDQVVDHLHQVVTAAKGDTAMSAFTHHVPVVMVGMALHRGRAQLLAGHDLSRVAGQTAFSIGIKTVGAVSGAHAGGTVGFIFGPHGAVVGAGIGAAAGVVGGQVLFDKLKVEPFNRAVAEMECALGDYWSSAPFRSQMSSRLEDEIAQRTALLKRLEAASKDVLASERWARWPAPEDAAVVATERYARSAVSAAQVQVATIRTLLRRADRPGDEDDKRLAEAQLGVMLINAPELAAWLGAEETKRQQIGKCRNELLRSRERLFPGSTAYATAKAVVSRARGSLLIRCIPGGRFFHDDSVTISYGLHASCPVLDEELDLFREKVGRKAKTPGQLEAALRAKRSEVLSKWERSIAEADESFSWVRLARRRRFLLICCDACRPKIDRRVEARLAEMASPRARWHIAMPPGEWRCDAHDLVACSTCVDDP